jgi:pyruvate kinase
MDLRKTKIVCTLGPSTSSAEGIAGLIASGMDVVRLNFSHGQRETHRETIRLIRKVAREADREVAILQDLGGPKIRLGVLPDTGVRLELGESVELAVEGSAPDGTLPVSYPHLIDDVGTGESILLADGAVELEVAEVRHDRLVCRVVNGGHVTSRKGVNLPQANLRVPAVTEKDFADLEVGLDEGVDFVALSFVRHEDDFSPVLKRFEKIERPPLLIAKIEKPQAVERLDPIIEVVDGLMVARGDLGVEMPPEKVPVIQKQIIHAARTAGRPVITATQMLRSMVDSPRPLRAEASDVANAVFDGTDALMLSEETAIGRYPEESVLMLHRIALEAEAILEHNLIDSDSRSALRPDITGALSRAACELASEIGAAAMITTTETGRTARLIVRHRPAAPVLGITDSEAVARQLKLSWGVISAATAALDDAAVLGDIALRELSNTKAAGRGDLVVVIAGLPLGVSDNPNMIRVHRLE